MRWFYRTTYRTFGTVLILVITVWVLSLASVPPPISIEEREYTAPPASSEDQREVGAAQLGGDQNSNAVENEVDRKNRGAFVLAKRGLNAQEGVWRASNATMYLTIAATAIGGFGLYVLVRTLQATQDVLREARATTRQATLATDAANESARQAALTTEVTKEALRDARQSTIREQRGYLTLEYTDITFAEQSPWGYLCLVCNFAIKNIGRTPVHDIQAPQVISATLILDDLDEADNIQAQEVYDRAPWTLGLSVLCNILHPGETFRFKTTSRLHPPVAENLEPPEVSIQVRRAMRASISMGAVIWYRDISTETNERRHLYIQFAEGIRAMGQSPGGDMTDPVSRIMIDDVGAIRHGEQWLHPDGTYTGCEQGEERPPTRI